MEVNLSTIKERWVKDPVLSKIKDLDKSELLDVINGSYIAKRFFGKSRSWFSQKLNGHIVNGKPAEFTKEELKTLANAISTITLELDALADDILESIETDSN